MINTLEKIQNEFSEDFSIGLRHYKRVRKGDRISRLEYIVLFVHFAVGTEILTSEPKLEKITYFKHLKFWDTELVEDYLKNAVENTSLCGQETAFLLEMISLRESNDFLEDYRKLFDSTDMSLCMLGPLFKKLFDRSEELEITKD